MDIQTLRYIIREILSEDFRYHYNRHPFIPPANVIATAKRALEVVGKYKLVKSDASNEGSGLQKAESLAAGEELTHEQLKRMKAFFDNNLEKVKKEKMAGQNMNTSHLIQKWELWGGDAAMQWVNRQITSTQGTNVTSKKLRPKGVKNLMDPLNTRNRDGSSMMTWASKSNTIKETTVGPGGVTDFELRNPFEKLMDKYHQTVNDARIIGHNIYEWWFPLEAEADLKSIDIQFIEQEQVTNKEHPDYGKTFLVFTANPQDWDAKQA